MKNQEPMIKVTPETTELKGDPIELISLVVMIHEKMDLVFEKHNVPLNWRYLVEKGEEAERLHKAGMSEEEAREVIEITKEAIKRP